MESEHLTHFGEIPNMEKNTAVNFTEKRTIPILQNIKKKTTWTLETNSRYFLRIFIFVITLKRS